MIYPIIVVSIVVLDQVSKWYMSDILTLCVPGACHSIELLPIFQLTLLHNSGAAFSFLDDAGGWQRWFLVSVSSLVSIFISYWLVKVWREEKLLSFGLAFILGGAIGNLIDRAFDGYVVDFLLFHYDRYYFPAFNVADSAVTIGAGLIIIEMFLRPKFKANVGEEHG